MKYAIAIDGPAGAGKSTIAKLLAKQLDILYLDTGSMYRAVGLKALYQGIDPKDKDAVSKMVESIDIKVKYHDKKQYIFLDQIDVSDKIRTSEVSMAASHVAVIKYVRLKMVELQRRIAQKQSLIMDGRDIGTYVLPDAKYKFYITASPEERAKRRYLEMTNNGSKNISYNEILNDIIYRDKNDSSREFAPLKQADDAVLIDTTNFTVDEVLQTVLSYINILDTEK